MNNSSFFSTFQMSGGTKMYRKIFIWRISMKVIIVVCSSLLAFLVGCTSMVLKPADFSWPIESVLKVDENGFIKDQRHSLYVNVKEMFFAETQDSLNIHVPVRIIRDVDGYYYLTAQKFRNVYIFEQVEGGLKLVNTIFVKPEGLESPAFNQRTPYIQLVNEKDTPKMLNKNGIIEGGQ